MPEPAPELAVLRGHDNYVGGAEFSPDGTRVVTSSSDHTARVWDATASEPLVTVGGPRFRVASAALSPTRAQLVVDVGRRPSSRSETRGPPRLDLFPRGGWRSRRQRGVQRRRSRHRHVGREGRRASLGSGHRQAPEIDAAEGKARRRRPEPRRGARCLPQRRLGRPRTPRLPSGTAPGRSPSRRGASTAGVREPASTRADAAWSPGATTGVVACGTAPRAAGLRASRSPAYDGWPRSAQTACAWRPGQTTARCRSGMLPAGER